MLLYVTLHSAALNEALWEKRPVVSSCGFSKSEVVFVWHPHICSLYTTCIRVCPSSPFKTSDPSSAFLFIYFFVLWWTDRRVCSPAATACKEHPLAAERGFTQRLRLRLITSSCHLANILGATQSGLTVHSFSWIKKASPEMNFFTLIQVDDSILL